MAYFGKRDPCVKLQKMQPIFTPQITADFLWSILIRFFLEIRTESNQA